MFKTLMHMHASPTFVNYVLLPICFLSIFVSLVGLPALKAATGKGKFGDTVAENLEDSPWLHGVFVVGLIYVLLFNLGIL